MEPFVIGIVGKQASGKGTITGLIKEITARERKNLIINQARFSDAPREQLTKRGVPHTRENLQKEVRDMEKCGIEKGEGPGSLSREIEKRIRTKIEAHIVIVDGVRWLTDEAMIRSFTRNAVVYVYAHEHVRYFRLLKRRENEGDEIKSFAQFLEEDSAPNEQFIDEIGARANLMIQNESTIDRIEEHVYRFLCGTVFPVFE